MEIAFSSSSLRAVCENEENAESELGTSVASALRRRLADLRSATNISDLLVGDPHPVDGETGDPMAVNLSESHRIVFCANHPKKPLNAEGGVDWSKVSRIKILRIEKNHE